MYELIIKIKNDIKINERCLQEDLPKNYKRLLKLWLDYDKELLKLIDKNNIK